MQFKLGLIVTALASSSMLANARPSFQPELSKRMTDVPQMEHAQAAPFKRDIQEQQSENWYATGPLAPPIYHTIWSPFKGLYGKRPWYGPY